MIWYERFMNGVETLIKYFLISVVAITTSLTLIEVIRRYCFGLSFVWSEELVGYLLLWLTFVGGSLGFKKGNLVLLDLAIKYIPQKYEIIYKFIVNTVVLVFISFLFRYAVRHTFSFAVMRQYSTGLGISMAIPNLGIPLGLGLMILFSLDAYKELFKNLLEGKG